MPRTTRTSTTEGVIEEGVAVAVAAAAVVVVVVVVAAAAAAAAAVAAAITMSSLELASLLTARRNEQPHAGSAVPTGPGIQTTRANAKPWHSAVQSCEM